MISRVIRLFAALALAGAVGVGYASEPAAALAPTHVAIVVANVGSACVPWHPGLTGADVLNANFDVLYGSPPSYAGFVLKINGQGTKQPDLTHYWVYFHNTGGGWTYSGSGAAGFHPQPGTVEGWAYDDGQDPAPRPPGSSYAAICGGQDPAPPPMHAPSHAPVTHHSTPPPAAQPGQPDGPGQRGQPNASTGTNAPTAPATSTGVRSTGSPTGQHRATGTSPGAHDPVTSHPVPSDAAGGAVQLVGAKPDPKHTSAAPALGTTVALLAAAGLGGTAFWRLRRQKHG